jgi:hypothetical protein
MIDAAVFGQVDQVGPLVAALTAVRDDAAELGRQVQARHADLAQRTAGVAAGGVRKIHVKE